MIKFTVLGIPTGKGRPKFAKRGNFVQTYTPEKTTNYENLVKLSYQQSVDSALFFGKDIPLFVKLVCYFPIPKSTGKKKAQDMLDGKISHTKKPDCDNVTKAVLDALNGIAFYDDSQVTDLIVLKRYSDKPRVEITIDRR